MQLISEVGLNFRKEIEVYLEDVETNFGKLREDVRTAMGQVSYKLKENEWKYKSGQSTTRLVEQTTMAQQLRGQERAKREQETKDTNARIETLMKVIEHQKNAFSTSRQKSKGECLQEMKKDVKTENGRPEDAGIGANHIVPSEGKKLPPGLFDGGDRRG